MKKGKNLHVAKKHLDLKTFKQKTTEDISSYDLRSYKTKYPDFSDALKGRTIKLKIIKR